MVNFLTRNLLSLIQKRFLKTSSASVSPSSPPNTTTTSSLTVQFLVNSCGLPLESAVSASKNFQIHEKNREKPQSVVEFLKAHSFTNTHIAKLIEKRPKILHCGVEDNLKPKFEFLIKIGFVGQLLPELVLSSPDIAKRGLDSYIQPSFEFLISVYKSTEKIVAVSKRSAWLLSFDLKCTMQPNIDFLVKEGVPVNRITRMEPRHLVQKHETMVHATNAVKRLGLEPKDNMFIHAMRVMLGMTELTWKKKIEMMKSVGWSEEEILSTFKRYPYFLTCSEEKFRYMIDFYLNTLKLGLQFIIAYPMLLKYSIDKRIRPRYNVLKVLESKKLIKWDKGIGFWLTLSERRFVKRIVIKYADKIPDLLDIYHGCGGCKKIDG